MSRSDCASLRSAVVGVRKRSVPVVGVVAVSEVRSVARFLEGGMYWGSGFLRLGCALTRFVDRFFDGGVYRGGSGLRLPECVVDQFFQSASLLRDMSLWRFQSCVGLCVSSSVSVGNAVGVGRLRPRCILSSKSCGLSSVSHLWIQILCVCWRHARSMFLASVEISRGGVPYRVRSSACARVMNPARSAS